MTSKQSPFTLASTTIFNVGGRRFEVSSSLLQQYPTSRLSQLVFSRPSSSSTSSHNHSSKEIFLDHNPEAFAVVLDYLRYGGKVLVPRTVCKEVVILQLSAFGFPVQQERLMEDSYKNEYIDVPSYDQAVRSDSSSSAGVSEKTPTLTKTASLALDRKIQTLVEAFLLPSLIQHAQLGHMRVRYILTDQPLRREEVATLLGEDTPLEFLSFTNPNTCNTQGNLFDQKAGLLSLLNTMDNLSADQRARILDTARQNQQQPPMSALRHSMDSLPSISNLLQPGVLKHLEEQVIKSSSSVRVEAENKELTVRRENEFGLLESFSVQSILVSVRMA